MWPHNDMGWGAVTHYGSFLGIRDLEGAFRGGGVRGLRLRPLPESSAAAAWAPGLGSPGQHSFCWPVSSRPSCLQVTGRVPHSQGTGRLAPILRVTLESLRGSRTSLLPSLERGMKTRSALGNSCT